MNCKKCGHDDPYPIGKCLEEVIDKNVEITGLDGKKHIEPEMPSICACKEPAHHEAVSGSQKKDSMTPNQAGAYAAILMERLNCRLKHKGTFECESCLRPLPVKDLGGVGVFTPDHDIDTKGGSRKLFAAYAVCSRCKERARKGDETVAAATEENLLRKGVFVDPTELQLSEDERKNLDA